MGSGVSLAKELNLERPDFFFFFFFLGGGGGGGGGGSPARRVSLKWPSDDHDQREFLSPSSP